MAGPIEARTVSDDKPVATRVFTNVVIGASPTVRIHQIDGRRYLSTFLSEETTLFFHGHDAENVRRARAFAANVIAAADDLERQLEVARPSAPTDAEQSHLEAEHGAPAPLEVL